MAAGSWSPRYLLRIDDVCATMDWAIWNEMEATMDAAGIRPIVGIVPDNRDPKLMAGPAAPDFWERVRGWQARGWTIGLHGYQHDYVTRESGILGLNHQSEFAGLPKEEQRRKIRAGLAIFQREGVRVDAWVAPSHSFDWTTVEVLREEGLQVISDGFAFRPFRKEGMRWVPQQFATMRRVPFGTWTFCHHPDLTPPEQAFFRQELFRLKDRYVGLADVLPGADRDPSASDLIIVGLRKLLALRRDLVRRLRGSR
jgi:peptidoglycan/xylan/chitin deacetylase (PgdA/CDA1 family)